VRLHFLNIATLLTAIAASSTALAAEAPPSPAALLFSTRCATCHTIGKGIKVGPDLLGVTDRRDKAWVSRFVRDPSAMIDGGDADAAALLAQFNGVRMPAQQLEDADIDGLWAYFAACTTAGGCEPVATGPRWGTDATAEEIATGFKLFSGEKRLASGGPPCFTCHHVRELGFMGGGTLGGDVTFAYATFGEAGLSRTLAELPTPVMAAIYGKAPLEADEQYALKALFASMAKDGKAVAQQSGFFLMGLEGMGIILAGLVIFWMRKQDTSRGKGK